MTQSPLNKPIVSRNYGELTGKEAWSQSLRLARMAAAKVASSLGPRGAYKLVTYHRGPELVVKVTKDAVEVLDELGVQYPAIKTIAEGAKLHRQEVGDGVLTMLVLVAELLGRAEKLIADGISPGTIVRGYATAGTQAAKMIDDLSKENHAGDGELLTTVDCGRKLLTPRLRDSVSEAVRELSEPGRLDPSKIRVFQKEGGSTSDSEFIRGAVVKKGRADPGMPEALEEIRVAVVDMKLEVKPLELKMKGEGPFPVKLNITSERQVKMFLEQERKMRLGIVEKLKAVGANAVFCRAKIDQKIASSLGREGIFAAQLVDQADLDAVRDASGANEVADVESLRPEDLGTASRLEVTKLGPDEITILRCGRGASFLLRGSSPELVQELERTLRNAVLILKHSLTNPRVVPGGGAVYMHVSSRLRQVALSYPSREQLAIDAFANALEQIPGTLARNYGLDEIDALAELRRMHSEGESWTGVTESGCTNVESKVVELASVSKAALRRACEIAILLLRIDHYLYVRDLPLVHKQ